MFNSKSHSKRHLRHLRHRLLTVLTVLSRRLFLVSLVSSLTAILNKKIIFLLIAIFIFSTNKHSYAVNFSDEERVVSKERVITIVTEYLKEHKEMSSFMLGKFKYSPLRLQWPIYSVAVSERRGSGKGKLLLELNFANRQNEGKKLFLSIPLLEAKSVVFMKSNHSSGDVLAEEDLLSGVKWLPFGEYGFISDLSSAVGKRVNKKIPEMMPLKKNMIESVPTLRKGDPVTIFVETEGILITAKGVAKEEALTGESIKVLNSQSKKIIQARVISKDAVRIEF